MLPFLHANAAPLTHCICPFASTGVLHEEVRGLHNGGVGVKLGYRLAAKPLDPCLHPSIRCEVVCQREDHSQPVLAGLGEHIVQALQRGVFPEE